MSIVRALSLHRVHDRLMNDREAPGVTTAVRAFTIADLHRFFDPTSATVGTLPTETEHTDDNVGTAQPGVQHSANAGTAQPS